MTDSDALIEELVGARERLATAGVALDDWDQLLLTINCDPNPRAELLSIVAGYMLIIEQLSRGEISVSGDGQIIGPGLDEVIPEHPEEAA